jgi:hypothetical protein
MADYCDPQLQSCDRPNQSTAPPASCPPAEGQEKGESGEQPGVASALHLGADAVELAADTAGKHALGAAAGVVGTGIAAYETVRSAVTGEGCPADEAMGMVPMMGPLSKVMMPSWCGPVPEATNSDTGMTPKQERDAGYMSPADPNAPSPGAVQPHFEKPGS